jgi:hypothetical protein
MEHVNVVILQSLLVKLHLESNGKAIYFIVILGKHRFAWNPILIRITTRHDANSSQKYVFVGWQ